MMIILICLSLFIISRTMNGFRLFLDSTIIIGFICLFFYYCCFDLIFISLTNLVLILILLVYSFSDILFGIRIIGLSIPFIRSIVLKYIDCKGFLQNKIRNHLVEIREIILVTFLFLIFGVQVQLQLPYINFTNYSLIEILGFDIAIFSLYGIYVAFLQFLTENDKVYYLGVSKIRFMLDNSVWSQLTRAKLFHIILLVSVLIPLFSKSNIEFNYQLQNIEYLWQTCYIISIVVYIFLLKLSISIVYGVFRLNLENVSKTVKKEDVKEKDSRHKEKIFNRFGITDKINISVQRSFKDEFWKIYKNQNQYRDDYIKVRLQERITLVEKADRDELIFTIFGRENWENYNLSESIFVFIENIDSDEGKQFFRFYKNFCIHKWNFLRDYQTDISPRTWVKLVEQDILIFDKLVKSDSTFNIFKIEFSDNAISRNLNLEKNKKIKEFLFELLLDKEGVNLDDVLISIKKEIQRFSQNKSDQFYRYTYDFLKFRLVTILDKYENDDVNINLPEYKSLSDAFQNGQRNDYENSMLYSKICFNYLDRGRIEDFSHTKVEADDSKEREKQKLKAQKIQGLILSMNEEYRMAFMLYQLFYTDRTQWDENLAFYDNNIQSIMKHGKQYHGYLFDQVKNIILSETDIDHRITESFLDKIWETKNETIMDFSWFDQFGDQHQMSNFKILYVQWILSGATTSYLKSRINFERGFPIKVRNSLVGKIKGKENRKMSVKDLKWRIRRKEERIGHLCRDYLLLTDQLTTIFTKVPSDKHNLQISVEYLLHSGKVNLSDVIDNISVTSLLRLEWLLRWNYYHYHRESNYTSRTFFDEMTSNDRYYWSAGRGILEFFIAKIVDNFYRDLYQDKEFMAGFKYHLESQLNSLNKTVEEYVELIAERVSGIDNLSILQKGQIISKLNYILFGQDNNIKIRQKENIAINKF